MADATTQTDSSATGSPFAIDPTADFFPTKAQITQAKEGLEKAFKNAETTEDVSLRSWEAKKAANDKRMEEMVKAQGVSAQELNKPWDVQGEIDKRQTSLWEQFGSPGFIFAMLGSAFSTMPMNAALQSGGAAIQALNQGKWEDYKRAFDAWKENNDLAIKRAKMEHDIYSEILEKQHTDMEAFNIELRAGLARFGHESGLALLEAGMLPQLNEAIEGQARAAGELAKTAGIMTERNAELQYINADPQAQKNPEIWQERHKRFQALGDPAKETYYKFIDEWRDKHGGESPPSNIMLEFEAAQSKAAHAYGSTNKEKEIDKIQNEIKAKNPGISEAESYRQAAQEVEESHRTLTANERYKQGGHIEQYNLALADILPQAENILRKHVGAAGIAGYATRAAESVSNILGGNETDRRQFESDIEQLRLMAPNLLLDRTGRPLSSEHELIAKIIRGLNLGDTTANTLRSLEELKKRLTALRDNAQQRLGGTAPQIPASDSSAPGWDEFPEVK